MLKRSFIVLAVIFIACNIAALYCRPDANYANTDIQTNIINADKYIYSNTNYQAVILGSSLANKIAVEELPGFYNLALSGLSVYDGGSVLLSRKTLPKTVFIELNVMQRPENENFTGEFTSSAYAWFKQVLPALRTENQPIILMKKAIDNVPKLLRPSEPAGRPRAVKKSVLKNYYLPQSLFKSLMAIQVKAYSERDTALINRSVLLLKNLVAKIEARESQVVFFEMPVNPVIQQSPKASLIRKTVKQIFPGYSFINLPPATFKTRDGLHLAQKEAMDYTLYFKAQTDSISRLN